MILLDTNVLIALRRLRLPEGEFALSSLVYAELRFGINHATDPEVRRARTEDIARAETLFSDSWLPFDRSAAEGYGFIAATVARVRPAHARSKDTMLAGHAYALGASLLTLNPKDFDLVADHVEIIVPERIH